jgi:hypothetical protein
VVVAERVVVCFDFDKVCADARGAAGGKGAAYEFEDFAMDVVSIGGGVAHETLDKAE